MFAYWPQVSFVLNLAFVIAVAVASWFIRDSLNKARMENDLSGLRLDMAALKDQFQRLDEAIRGNGKIGLCEQTRNLERRVEEMDRRVIRLEDAA
ncbi:MAG TPA: hypothetical protein PLV10_08960 [Candidatus Latescibacteria bacterium]|nr:hypothetical protein [Candidatus Latescibacterota bacterium]